MEQRADHKANWNLSEMGIDLEPKTWGSLQQASEAKCMEWNCQWNGNIDSILQEEDGISFVSLKKGENENKEEEW